MDSKHERKKSIHKILMDFDRVSYFMDGASRKKYPKGLFSGDIMKKRLINTSFFFFFFFFFFLVFLSFRAAAVAYGSSQARGLIRAVTASLHHSNAGSLTHWVRLGIEPANSQFLVGFVSLAPRWEHPKILFWREIQTAPLHGCHTNKWD